MTDRKFDRWWLWVVPIVVIGYFLISFAIVVATQHGVFDPGASRGNSTNPLLGPFNMLVIWSSNRRGDGALLFFYLFSLALVPALIASFGRSGCLPGIARIAAVGVWTVADVWAWLASVIE